ncbi:MAG: ABC transporter permease [Gemmatimonadaceae bacterium]
MMRQPLLLAELWQYRELLRRLMLRNLKVRYQRSVLGFAWTLLNPLLTILILVTVFATIIRIGVPNYWAFLVSGYFAWVFILHTVGASAYIIPDHAYMARGVPIPADVLVLSTVAARLVEFAAEMLIVVVVLAVFHHHALPPSFAFVPLLIVLNLALTTGLALPAAALSVFFRDVQHALPVALTLLAYVSPVFYPLDIVPEGLRRIYFLNPLAGLFSLYHVVLYEGRAPSGSQIASVASTAVMMCGIGYLVFRRYRSLFAEIV